LPANTTFEHYTFASLNLRDNQRYNKEVTFLHETNNGCSLLWSLTRAAVKLLLFQDNDLSDRDTGTGVHDGNTVPLTLERGATVVQAPLHNSIIGNFRDFGKRWNHGGIPLALLKGGQPERRCLFIAKSQGILWFIKISLKQIYCSYSLTH